MPWAFAARSAASVSHPSLLAPRSWPPPAEELAEGASCPMAEGTGTDLAILLVIRRRSNVLSSLERMEPAESRWCLGESDVVMAAVVGSTGPRRRRQLRYAGRVSTAWSSGRALFGKLEETALPCSLSSQRDEGRGDWINSEYSGRRACLVKVTCLLAFTKKGASLLAGREQRRQI